MKTGTTGYVGQRLLLWLIALYQRFFRGRGLFSRVRCSFEHAESCSRYGERVVREVATSAPEALALIFRRLRRCRQAAIYRDDDRRWLWGPVYDHPGALDHPAALERALVGAHERADSQAVVLQSAAIVAYARGERRGARDLLVRARAITSAERLPRPLARDSAALQAGLRRRLHRRLAIAGAMLGLGAAVTLIGSMIALVVSAGGALALVVAALLTYRERRGRFDQLRAAARFQLPLSDDLDERRCFVRSATLGPPPSAARRNA